uniref:Uncharacterized protein n=1 Tax=Arundo donax TaxID=35708 RepID=A0A0A9EX54_ARUDO
MKIMAELARVIFVT